MMRKRLIELSIAAACFAVRAEQVSAADSGRFAFSYGGRLTSADGAPLGGAVDLELAFYRTEAGGDPLSAPLAFPATSLSTGVFQLAVTLDPTEARAVFPDTEQPVWIEVRDLTHGRTYPRQRFLGAPYALRVPVDGVTLQFDAAGALQVVQAPALSGALSGDVEGEQASTVVTRIQGAPVASTPAASGQVLKWNGAAWAPADDAGSAAANSNAANLTSGTLDDARLSANVSLLGPTIEGGEVAAGTIASVNLADGAVSSAKLADGAVTAGKLADAGCAAGQLLKWNGSAWACANDTDTNTPTTNASSLSAGTLDDARLSANVSKLGATIEGSEIAAGAVSSTQLADGAVTAAKLASAGCSAGQMLKWNGTAWACASDVDTNTPTTDAADLTTGTLDDARLSASVSKLGATIEGSEIADGTITAGDIASGAVGDAHVAAGIDALKIGGGSVSNAELAYLDGVTSPLQTQLAARVAKTGDELSGSLSVNIPAGAGTQNAVVVKNSQRLRFENDQVSPNSISLRAPTGVFTNQTYVLPAAPGTAGQVLQTDASGNLSWTTPGSSLSSLTQLTVSCAAGQVIKSDGGGTWSCQADADSGGAGGSTPADGSVSTAKLVDGAVTAAKLNAMGCLSGQLLKYNGSTWTCAADDNNNVTSDASLLTSGTVAEARLPATVSLLGATIDTSEIADGAVTTAKLAADAVTSAKILDGSIANADISGSAAIATSKLSGAVTAISGHGLGALATLSFVGTSEITDSSIGNADISGTAAIATSKLSGAVTQITGHGLGSLATLSAVGSTEITNGSIADADISGTAAISSTKISFVADSISGNAVDGGTISNFASTGIDDDATTLAMTINSAGNLGIGTTSPAGKLDIYSASSPEVYLRDANSGLRIVPILGANFIQSGTAGPTGSADLHFSDIAAANTWMTIKANGNVGIASTSPGSKLTVNGVIESTSGGFKYPDGTVQTTANASYGCNVYKQATFDGTTTYLSVPSSVTSQWNNSGFTGLTFAVWADFSGGGSFQRLIDFGNGQASSNILFGRYSTGTSLYFSVLRGSSGQTVTATGAIANDTLTHYAVTMTAAGLVKIFKNGVLLTSATIQTPNTFPLSNNYIGESNWAVDDFYSGVMSDVQIYNTALPDADIPVIMGGVTKSNLIARYLNNADVNDSSGNARHATLSGTQTYLTRDIACGVSATQWTTSGSAVTFTTGNVGIGTASPTGLLDVSGKLTVLSGGNVGVGTTAPSSALELNGAMTMKAMAAPSVSAASTGRAYFDSTSNKLKASENGAAYYSLIPDYILITHEVADGTNGGSVTANTWNVRPFNKEEVDTGGHASVSGDVITLSAGTYECEVQSTTYETSRTQLRLYNVTASSVMAYGNVTGASYYAMPPAQLKTRFTLSGSTQLRVEQNAVISVANSGFGLATGWTGSPEVYASFECRRY